MKTPILILALLGTCLFIAFFPALQMPGGLSYASGARETVAVFGGDIGFYVEQAQSLIDKGRFDSWHTSIFPPGMAVIVGAILKFSNDTFYIAKMQVVSVVLWVIALLITYRSLYWIENRYLRFIAIHIPWLFDTFRDWTFGIGTIYSESKAMPLFVASLSCLILGLKEKRTSYYAWSGFLMATAAFTRIYFATVGQFIYAGILVTQLGSLYLSGRRSSESLRPLQGAIVAFIVFNGLMTPWKLRNLERHGHFDMGPGHYHMTFYNLWIPSEKLPAFIIAGNSACVSNEALCKFLATSPHPLPDSVYRDTALATLILHPLPWFVHRMSHFGTFWVNQSTKPKSLAEWRTTLEGILVFLFVITSILWSVEMLRHGDSFAKSLAGIILGFTLHSITMFTFAGMDYRHSLPVRFFYALVPLWISGSAYAWQIRRWRLHPHPVSTNVS